MLSWGFYRKEMRKVCRRGRSMREMVNRSMNSKVSYFQSKRSKNFIASLI